jgi:hypothetical protein
MKTLYWGEEDGNGAERYRSIKMNRKLRILAIMNYDPDRSFHLVIELTSVWSV